MSYIHILALDPGKNNFAAAVCTVDVKTGMKFKIIHTCMILNTVTDLTQDIDKQAAKFRQEIRILLKDYNIDYLVAERFIVRGRFMGASSEFINFMIGSLSSIKVEKKLITAAQWKNAFNKIYDLKEFYKQIPLVPHKVDAALIGLYGSHYLTDTKPFECIKDNIPKCRSQLIKTESK